LTKSPQADEIHFKLFVKLACDTSICPLLVLKGGQTGRTWVNMQNRRIIESENQRMVWVGPNRTSYLWSPAY